MNENFITKGLEEDRYLKADKLVHRFRNQIKESLEDLSEEIIEKHENLFTDGAELDYEYFGVENSRTLTTIRIEFDLNSEHEKYGTRRLNIGLEWVEPAESVEGKASDNAYSYILYKIQRGSNERFNTVKEQTKNSKQWDTIQFGEDQWPYTRKEAPGIVYIPVESGQEINENLQKMKAHFSEVYAPEIRKK